MQIIQCSLKKLIPQINVRHQSSTTGLNRLKNRVAIVTGSTEGIGYAIVERFAKEGAKVIVSSRKQENVDKALDKLAAQNLAAHGLVCHVANAEDRKKLYAITLEKYGGMDILVTNAAVNPSINCPVLDCDELAWDKIFDVNVKSSYLLAKETLPYLRKSSAGRILFLSSVAGYKPHNPIGAYSVSKTAVLGLTKAAALQLAQENITVNCITPGVIPTKFANILLDDQEKLDYLYGEIPMKRTGKTEDVAAAAAFLASDEANYITGESIVISGGMLLRI